MTFMSVQRERFQKAFALAHRLACDPDIGDRERKYFRLIATEIWNAAGEETAYPESLKGSGLAAIAAEAIASHEIAQNPDYHPPVNSSEFRHVFVAVEGNRYCGQCGAGKLHSVHQRGGYASGRAVSL